MNQRHNGTQSNIPLPSDKTARTTVCQKKEQDVTHLLMVLTSEMDSVPPPKCLKTKTHTMDDVSEEE